MFLGDYIDRGPDSRGCLDPRVAAVHEQPRHALIWGTQSFPREYHEADTIVYGHWNNATMNAGGWPTPMSAGCTIGIDTISHGVLTAVRLPDPKFFQCVRYDVPRSDG